MARKNPPPFESSRLPAAIAGISSPCELEDAIENHMASGGQTSADLLVAHAWAVFETALEVMVDEVVPRGERALSLLERAGDLGADPSRTRSLRERIRRAVRQERDRVGAIMALLARPLEELDAEELADVAHTLDGRKQPDDKRRAAQLYDLAARHPKTRTKQRGYLQCRAVFARADAGDLDAARADLERILDGDLIATGSGKAFAAAYVHLAANRLLAELLVNGDPAAVERLCVRADATAARVGDATPFPRAHKVQEDLLRFALEHGLEPRAKTLHEEIAARPPKDLSPGARSLLEKGTAVFGFPQPKGRGRTRR
jgi:hypothetical protein